MKDKIRGIIFDLGGVIVDGFGEEFLEYASRKLGVSKNHFRLVVRNEEIPLYKGKENQIEFWHRVCKELRIKCPSNYFLSKLWIVPYKKHAKIRKAMLNLAKTLRKNNYKIAILSNTIEEHSKINKKRSIFEYFDSVILSNEEGAIKPEKRFFQLASKKLELPFSQLLFIDDTRKWTIAAKKYGLRTILFKNEEQLEVSLQKIGINICAV